MRRLGSSRALLQVTALALLVGAAGCGVSINDAAKQNRQAVPSTQPTPQINPHPARLPPRPAGRVDVDGQAQGSLTPAVVSSGIQGVTVNLRNNGAQTAFGELCAGQIDAVDSSSPIPPTVWQTCARNGVKPIQFQVAADAVVVATKNEFDVGVDCMTLGQIQELFRAGSPINNWNQVNNAFDIPVRTAGPTPADAAFAFFSRYVLLTDPPSLTAFRSDYHQYPTDDGIRYAVIGQAPLRKTASFQAKARHDLAALRQAIASKQRFINQAQLQLQTDQGSGAASGTIASDQNNLNTLKAQLAQLQASLPAAIRFAEQTNAAAARIREASGTAGIFRFSYYELWEEQLRPIEVDANPSPVTPASHNCIFPSQQTVTDATFPLARQLLITVSSAGLRRPEVQAFLSAYLAQSQSLATRARLVPLPDSNIAQEKGWVSKPSSAPVIVYSTAQIQAARQAAQTGNRLPAIQPTTSLPAGPTASPTSTTSTTTTTTNTGGGRSQTSAPAVGPQS